MEVLIYIKPTLPVDYLNPFPDVGYIWPYHIMQVCTCMVNITWLMHSIHLLIFTIFVHSALFPRIHTGGSQGSRVHLVSYTCVFPASDGTYPPSCRHTNTHSSHWTEWNLVVGFSRQNYSCTQYHLVHAHHYLNTCSYRRLLHITVMCLQTTWPNWELETFLQSNEIK